MGVMTRLLLLLWAGVAVSTAVDLHKRIIRGTPCLNTERLYHVKLNAFSETHESLCGGSLISDSWILTAAHCWIEGRTLKAVLGVHGGQNSETVTITEHEIYSNTDGEHDIMLLKLPKSTDLPTVTLPDCSSKPSVGDTVQIAGHGATTVLDDGTEGNDEPVKLHCADIKVVDCTGLNDCLKKRTDDFQKYSYQHLLCGEDSSTDIAEGDSGGGVIYTPPGQTPMIYGVNSFSGDIPCTFPVVFMDVCEYIDWINEKIKKP